ncbi:MAG: hypothetical protein OEV15_02740 [Gallionella sp.]|nr:hypothetical protein [Gallionella sp.]
MTRRAITLWLTLLSLTAAPGSQAEPQLSAAPPTAEGGAKQSSREVIQQKLILVKMLLSKSSTIERAAQSDDPAIKQQGAAVLALYAKANSTFEQGDMAEAEKILDEVLSLITDTSRLAPDPARIEAEQRARYAELVEGVQGIQITYQEMRKDMSPKDKQLASVDLNIERTRILLNQAQTLAKSNRYKEAIFLLDNAYTAGIADLNKLMGSAVLTYEYKFKTPAEEFNHEMARYRSFEELIPIARTDLKPSEAAIKMSERYVQESNVELDAAKKQAAAGDHKTAITTLQEATKRLQTALRTLGLMTPE